MSIGDRLRSERENLGLSQPKFAAIAGTTKQTLFSWESGKTAPDGFQLSALAAAGADIRYILTGQRDGPAPERLSEDERALLADYREASGPVRRAARAALQSGSSAAPVKKSGIKVGTLHGQYIEGDITNHGGMSFGAPPPTPPPATQPAKPLKKQP